MERARRRRWPDKQPGAAGGDAEPHTTRPIADRHWRIHGDREARKRGGGADFGMAAEAREQVPRRCEIGGFAVNAIHNAQARTPAENLVAMVNAVHAFNGERR